MNNEVRSLTVSCFYFQVWFRPLQNGDVAVALYNPGAPPVHPFHTACDANATNTTTGMLLSPPPLRHAISLWTLSSHLSLLLILSLFFICACAPPRGGYWAPRGAQPQSWCFAPGAFAQSLLDWYCCNSADCAGYNYSTTTGAGCLFKDTDGDFVAGGADVVGVTKVAFRPPTGKAADVSVDFASVGLFAGAPVQVYDLWAQRVVANTTASGWTATVPWQGTAFFRLSQN